MLAVRLQAVLFTDIVGSTAWRAAVGDSEADRLTKPFDDLIRQTIHQFRGTVIKSLGDGFLVVFDSASDAIAGAVAIQQAVDSDHRAVASAGLDIRIGVSVGDVTERDGDVHGIVVVEAARLCAAANGRQILCRDLVTLLAGNRMKVNFAPIAPMELKGLPAPIDAVEVFWEPHGSPLPLPATLLGDYEFEFVGRDVEYRSLLEAWKDACHGHPRALFVSGEPGIGKTRLVSEAARALHDDGAIVLFGRCEESLGVPFQPFVEILAFYLEHADVPVTGRFGGDLTRLAPELTERVPGLAKPLDSDPETERYRLFEAVTLWLGALSASHPVVVVLDDLQWATQPTLMLLRHVLSSSSPSRLMVVAIYRDSDVDRDHPLAEMLGELLRNQGSAALAVEGFDVDDVLRLVSSAAGRELGITGSAAARAIQDATDGNAFFVSEVLHHLSEHGALVEAIEHWAAGGRTADLGIPRGVREVVRRRLSRLDPLANEALVVAATIGKEFSVRILALAGSLDLNALESTLRTATVARLVEEVPGSAVAFRFVHELVRTTVYEDLSRMRRVALHRRVGEAIESLSGPAAAQAANLAFHYEIAAADGDPAKAIEWTIAAGHQAATRLAHREALSYFQRAAEWLDQTGRSADAQHCDVLIEIGRAQWVLGDDSTQTTLLQAADMAHRLADPDREANALLANNRGMPQTIGAVHPRRIAALERAIASSPADCDQHARLMSELALALVYVPGSYPRRSELAESAVALARKSSSPATLATALHNSWISIWAPGTMTARHRTYAELDHLGAKIDDPLWHALAQPRRIIHAVERYDIDAAWCHSEAFDAMAAELELPLVSWSAGVHRAALLEIRGDFASALESAEDALAHGLAAGQPDALLFHGSLTGMVAQWRDENAALVEQLEPIYEAFPDVPAIPPFLSLMLQRVGRTEDARRVAGDLLRAPAAMMLDGTTLTAWTVLADLVQLSEATEFAPALIALLRPLSMTVVGNGVNWNQTVAVRLGGLEALASHWDLAATALDQAVEGARRMRAPVWEANAISEQAWLCARRQGPGDRDTARQLIDRSLELAAPIGAHHIGYRCDRVRQQLES